MIMRRCAPVVLVLALCTQALLAQDLPPVTDNKAMALQARARRHPQDPSAFSPLVEEVRAGNRDALTALIELALDPETRWFASFSLADIGPPALPALSALRSMVADFEGDMSRAIIVGAIGEIGPAAEPAVGDLADALREPKICPMAATSLASIGRSPSIAVPALEWAIENAEPSCQAEAIKTLGYFQTSSAVDVLVTTLNSRTDYFRVIALEALGRIGPMAAYAEDSIAALLDSEDRQLRSAAEMALTLITGRSTAEGGDDELLRAIKSVAKSWYSANRTSLDFDGVCVNPEPVGGVFLISAMIDRVGAHADIIRYGKKAQPQLAAQLAPLIEELRRHGFSVAVDDIPCEVFSARAAPG